jgi:hypothetical protein
MIHTSILVLLLGLLYHDMSLGSGAQTIRPGWAGPVSYLFDDVTLTGCFLFSAFSFSVVGSLYSVETENLYFIPRNSHFTLHA